MANILGAFPAALIAANAGMTGAEFIRELRAAGMGARESEVRALLRLAQQTLAKNSEEPFANPSEVPSMASAVPWPTVKATGFKQAVEITYRVKATGTLITVPYQVTSETGVTREQAIAKAIQAYSDKAEEYGQELVGAVHTKTFRLVPTVI